MVVVEGKEVCADDTRVALLDCTHLRRMYVFFVNVATTSLVFGRSEGSEQLLVISLVVVKRGLDATYQHIDRPFAIAVDAAAGIRSKL